MKIPARAAALPLCISAVVVITGCSSKETLSGPDTFCRTPVKSSAISPLLPKGEDLRQKYSKMRSEVGAFCNLGVDDKQVLHATVLYYKKKPEPVDWKSIASMYDHGATRSVSFSGTAMIAPEKAIIRAKCDSASEHMQFVLRLNGDRVDESPTGYKKLQRFANDFVPNVTKKYGCTS
ncbi:hypothetical protein [Streptomyces boncukensis]|uniref:Lipoprotein n=1 Tax=Streptomyces boncukensis TaxID=2711219 RepID=A0A6G4X9L4_9ACTN|nr:hypothetical protein [Streptomyces boncukensis]NGO73351.1 hypothetical protein [Streptomyces boncukensis]